MPTFIKAAALGDLPENSSLPVKVGTVPIALHNVEGRIYATHDTCLHAAASLGTGTLKGRIITCPLHSWKYDVTTGRCETIPLVPLATYEVRLEGEEILVGIPEEDTP